jgi:HSP20 family protein
MPEITTERKPSSQERSGSRENQASERIPVSSGEGRSGPRGGEGKGRDTKTQGHEAAREVSTGQVSPGEGREMPYREKRELQQQEGTRAGLYFEPPVDIYETEESLTLVADLPGVAPEDIDVDLRENLLTITAPAQPVDPRWRPLYQEYRVGHFLRQFRVGQQIDQSRISAQIRDGVLTLTLPKVESALPRRIQVQTS